MLVEEGLEKEEKENMLEGFMENMWNKRDFFFFGGRQVKEE